METHAPENWVEHVRFSPTPLRPMVGLYLSDAGAFTQTIHYMFGQCRSVFSILFS